MLLTQAVSSLAQPKQTGVEIVETSAGGNKLARMQEVRLSPSSPILVLKPSEKFQTLTGFGGSFTEASASLLNRLSAANRDKIIQAYFGPEGARYSLTRTHINSCDFSLKNYAYAAVPGDKDLTHFSIEEDRNDLIPFIKAAQKASKDGFSIIASPWTAPPWMKDNQDWRGGKLLPEYRDAWAFYFVKYIREYEKAGIPIWAVTVENEPLGNDKNWESMHFTPEEMTDFVRLHLGPKLEAEGLSRVKILGYDQNRGEELEKWARVMYRDAASSKYFSGMAVHWYASTFDFFPGSLQFTHKLAPGKHLINTEACVDAQVPAWNDDAWYWKPEAKDWGWTWAPEDQKHLHPKYVPVFRYARDIIGCLNNQVDGWVDWNMVLDRQGGPNWFKNWCTAPVIVDPEADQVYFTPLYHTLAHFSKYLRPGAVRIGLEWKDKDVMATAVQNPDGTLAVVLFNPGEEAREVRIQAAGRKEPVGTRISAKAIQTILIH